MKARVLGLVSAVVVLGVSPVASADSIDECIDAAEQGQKQRKQGRWLKARSLWQRCTQAACPGEIRRDCVGWLEKLEARLPGLVIRARDRKGNELRDVRVSIDGVLVTSTLDGLALPADPGERALRLEHAGAPPVEKKILLVEGEAARLVEIVFETPGDAPISSSSAPPPPPPPPSSVSSLVFVFGGVALLGGLGTAYFGLRARDQVDEMRGTCAPRCEASRVDDARRDALFSNLSLGVGVASLGAALWFLSHPASPPATSVWLGPGSLGASYQGRF